MDIRTVTTVTAVDSAGNVVEAIPVREWVDGDTNAAGHPVGAIDAYEATNGMPVRYVSAAAAQNSVGDWVDTMPVRTGGDTPVGFGFIRIGSPSSSQLIRIGGSDPAPRIAIPMGA